LNESNHCVHTSLVVAARGHRSLTDRCERHGFAWTLRMPSTNLPRFS
jgi:hypothetical protein